MSEQWQAVFAAKTAPIEPIQTDPIETESAPVLFSFVPLSADAKRTSLTVWLGLINKTPSEYFVSFT
jgi:hypothetical protein